MYQSRWYVPFGSSTLDNTLGTTPATRHCDGSEKQSGETAKMIRVDAGSVASSPVDWNKDGTIISTALAQDIDYNGNASEGAFHGYDDWSHIDLQQVGGRRNVIKLSLDIGKTDLAAGDSGLGDSGLGDFGLGDSGLGDSGLGDSGLGDSGLGDSGLGADLDFETALSLGNAPSQLKAQIGKQSITLNWVKPNLSTIVKYSVFRATGTITGSNQPSLIGTVWGMPPATTFVDNNVKNNGTYTYVVVMTDDRGNQSNPSNLLTVTK